MKILIFICLTSLGFARAFAGTSEVNSVDGTLIHREGNDYKIVSYPDKNKVQVYVTGKTAPLPSVLVVRVKKKGKILERLHLNLDQKAQDRAHYTGIVPASVSISGGVTFDIEFRKKSK